MPSHASGRIAKVRKHSSSQRVGKTHRWESFTTKISKFNSLHPLRRVRRHDLETENESTYTSYFQTGLQKWSELNVSKTFSDFRRDVQPLSESLPQIIHFQDRIMDLLVEYISREEKDILEPLLDLLTALAHDLGIRFEKYYGKCLDLMVAIAGKKQDVEVIEWTFGTLAFLFKYLSKLLVPDLRPTYTAMASLLGKTRQPPHIARFTAEALSFLVKKAAAPSHRETALSRLVTHICSDVVEFSSDSQFLLYKDGVMTMFSEAIKSTDNSIHTGGAAIMEALIDAIPEQEGNLVDERQWTDLICGVLTSVIHHSTAETFGDLLDSTLAKIQARMATFAEGTRGWQFIPLIRIIGTLAGVRKGSRIQDWPLLVGELVAALERSTSSVSGELSPQEQDYVWNDVISNVALVWHHASVDTLISNLGSLTQLLVREPLMRWFIPFCAYCCELDARRFASMFRNEIQKFIALHWSEGRNEEELCVLLPKIIESRGLQQGSEKSDYRIPQRWQDQMVSRFERLEGSPFPEQEPQERDPRTWGDNRLRKYAALLHLLELTTAHPSTNARIAEILLRKLKLALRPSSALASDEVEFIISQGFHAYFRMSRATKTVDHSLRPLLRAAFPRYAHSPGFVLAYQAYEEHILEGETVENQAQLLNKDSNEDDEPMVAALVKNLSSPSHTLRLASLRLLAALRSDAQESALIGSMIQIEQTPLTAANTRTIAMLLRNLVREDRSSLGSDWIRPAVPRFLFGMLTVKLAPIWDESTSALLRVSQDKIDEEVVSTIAFEWLAVPSVAWTPSDSANDHHKSYFASDFSCTSVSGLRTIADDLKDTISRIDDAMLESLIEGKQTADPYPRNARSRSLKVLNTIPSIAERRSRQLVPYFLSWATEDERVPDDSDEEQSGVQGSKWSLADRKSLLGVFAQFVNPGVLYSNSKVYESLLRVLENGDAEVQKLALKAILAWKQPGVKAYQENLEYLLDDARLKNELTVFLQGEDVIKTEHRAELMPVLLRLLYGRVVSKRGKTSGRQGPQSTRIAVLRNLSVEDMGSFIDIALGGLKSISVIGPSAQHEKHFNVAVIPPRNQLGMLNMLQSIITELGTNVKPYTETIVNAVLYCLIYSSRRLREAGADPVEEPDEEGAQTTRDPILKSCRTTGLKCLTALFQNDQDFSWEPYHGVIVNEIVAPRITKLPAENAYGVSGILQMFLTWSCLPKVALFLGPHGQRLPDGTLPQIIACLSLAKGKEEVKVLALQIVCNLVKLATADAKSSESNELIKAELIDPNAGAALSSIATILENLSIGSDLLESCIEAMMSLAPILETQGDIKTVAKISTILLRQPPRRVNPKLKGRILVVVESISESFVGTGDEAAENELYDALCALFSYFKDRENRQILSRVIQKMCRQNDEDSKAASLCIELNSFKEGRIDEPDYDRRLSAFSAVSRQYRSPFTPRQWLPILYNLVYFIRDDAEFGVLSSNAADGLRRYIQNVVDCEPGESRNVLDRYLGDIVLTSIFSGAKDPSDTVRREHLRVLGFLLHVMPTWPPVADMTGLLDEVREDSSEPAFFFNLLSPAIARQLEALATLEKANVTKEMTSHNLSQFLIPLLEHFIYGRGEGDDDRGLSAQAIKTIACLSSSLQWKQYRTLIQRYIGYVGSKSEHQKQTVRLLRSCTDALVSASKIREAQITNGATAENMQVDGRRLSSTVPDQAQLSSEIVTYFLPPLLQYLHEKDESEVSHRVPVGVILVNLLTILPAEQMDQKLAGVLTDISHILRSKATESRDMARDTLVQIALTLGPTFFGFILKELRGALKKGYQLHVLSYTMHSILVAVVPTLQPGDLDYCLSSIVMVVMDDIFGVVGQEKDAEGYISQMKEVKSSKSQDSMELVAKNVSVTSLIDLVKPLRSLLLQKVDLKMVRKIDALLSRIGAGLLLNPAAESRDTLVFCYEVIQDVYESRQPEVEEKVDPRVRKYLIQRGAKKSAERGRTTKNTYKLIRFAIDILRFMFKRHDSLRIASNLAGFIPIIGDVVIDGEEEVRISAFRLLTVVVKVPFASEDGMNIYKLAVKEAVKAITTSNSTGTDLSQASLKLLAVVLRDRRDVPVKDAAVDALLGKLKDDLTEPIYRHVTFNFLRSMLERRIETAAVYDIMDYVGTVMITNDDKDTRDLARGAFFQFIREYPQKKARWEKQLNFVVANLKYDREGGRLSVMEMIHLLLMKSSDEFVQELSATCFLPLFMVLLNDESDKCRLAAGQLIKGVFSKANQHHTQSFLGLLRSWLDKNDSPTILKAALLVFGHYFDSSKDAPRNKSDLKSLMSRMASIMEPQDIRQVDTELLAATLSTFRILVSSVPDFGQMNGSDALWIDVARCMKHDSPEVKQAAVQLVSLQLADTTPETLGTGKVGGLVQLALGILNTREVEFETAQEASHILIFLAPHLPAAPQAKDAAATEDEIEGLEDEKEPSEERSKDLQYLFWRLSHVLRKEIPAKATAIAPKTCAMEVLETVSRRSSLERLQGTIKTILVPLHHLTDPSIPVPQTIDEDFKAKHEALKTRAQIAMGSLQKKLGTSEYSKQLMAVRDEVRAKREQRSSKRKIEAITNPEKHGQDKRKKFDKNKERRKARSKEQKEMRQSYKGW